MGSCKLRKASQVVSHSHALNIFFEFLFRQVPSSPQFFNMFITVWIMKQVIILCNHMELTLVYCRTISQAMRVYSLSNVLKTFANAVDNTSRDIVYKMTIRFRWSVKFYNNQCLCIYTSLQIVI